MIKVYENVLEEHVALGVHEHIKNVSWKHNYPSAPNKPDRHWHVLCGEDGELSFDFDWVDIYGRLQTTNTILKKIMGYKNLEGHI